MANKALAQIARERDYFYVHRGHGSKSTLYSEGILIKSERLPIRHRDCCVTAERDGSLECLSEGLVVAR